MWWCYDVEIWWCYDVVKWWKSEVVMLRCGEMVKEWNGEIVMWWNCDVAKLWCGEIVMWRNCDVAKLWSSEKSEKSEVVMFRCVGRLLFFWGCPQLCKVWKAKRHPQKRYLPRQAGRAQALRIKIYRELLNLFPFHGLCYGFVHYTLGKGAGKLV